MENNEKEPISLFRTIPAEEQDKAERLNPNPVTLPQQHFNWNLVFSVGWISASFYHAQMLRPLLVESNIPQERIVEIYKILFKGTETEEAKSLQ